MVSVGLWRGVEGDSIGLWGGVNRVCRPMERCEVVSRPMERCKWCQ